jgi:hypothetical protein
MLVFTHIVIIGLIIYSTVMVYLEFGRASDIAHLERAKKKMPFFFAGPLNNPRFYGVSYRLGGILIILMLLFIEYMLITVGIQR